MKKTASTPQTPDWAAIRPRYEDADQPLTEIADEAGVSWQSIAAHAKRNGWALRQPPKSPTRRAADLAGAALMPSKLASRLKRLIAREIDAIEGESTEDRPALERERDARRLSSLVRSLEKLNDIKAAKEKRDPRRADNRTGGGDGAMRAELARRLARIAAGGGPDGVSGEPEPGGDGVAS
ncbi:MAG: hypothetical protein K8R18_08040 [Parvibaculum sp.]|uniref:hypothetical protein n=1 Tax=Parvibaculum sp. TaxID=2024848 RepID=UPI0025E9819C|nr:hypothetical protein [Parvibaculum sp.]MCE9649556.1 hypothetical protein [Parvibaculum sp.]